MKYATIAVLFLLQGCANGMLEKRLDEKIAEETHVATQTDLSDEAKDYIQKLPNLTQNQRFKLMELRETTRSKMESLANQSLRLKSILIKDLLSASYDEDEVQLIKKRIRKIEEQQLSVIFDAVDRTNGIFGRADLASPHTIGMLIK